MNLKPRVLTATWALLLAVACGGGQDPDPSPDDNGATASPVEREAVRIAVHNGLTWLAAHQERHGGWDLVDFTKKTRRGSRGRSDGQGLTEYNVGATGLAMLAFIEAGHDHMRPGPWRLTLRRAVDRLKKIQEKNGIFGKEAGNYTYNHAIATYALAEMWLVSGDRRLKPYVRRGVDWLLAAQNDPDRGGAWRYANYKANPQLIDEHVAGGGAINDTSVTTWATLALISSRDSGLAVPSQSFEGVRSWLDHVHDEKSGTYGYTKKLGFVKGRKFATTALGVTLQREVFNQDPGKALRTLNDELPDWKGVRDLYYWYAGTRALKGLDTDQAVQWRARVFEALSSSQNNNDREDLYGSWDPFGASWGEEYGGRVYTTAIAVLTLASL